MPLDEDNLGEANSPRNATFQSPAVVGWGIASLALAIAALTFNTSPIVLGASFMAKAFAVLVGAVLGTVGALIGNTIRKFAQPDAVFTQSGFLGLIWIRVFWTVGPQVIGLLAGVFVGAALVLR